MGDIFQYLPESYKASTESKEIVEALTNGFTEKLDYLLGELNNYSEHYLDPKTCQVEWLEVIAFWSGWGKLWDASWDISAKRELLIHTNELWENRGNIKGIEILADAFDYDISISASSGFIAGVSLLPVSLNASPYELEIVLPASYENTSKQKNINRLLKYFLPCWVNLQIVFI